MQFPVRIRPEAPADVAAVRHVNAAAFPTPAEARLVDVLRDSASDTISLVAEVDGNYIVGHIFFSPVTIDGLPRLKLAGLAPMAVLPGYQRRGIGSALVTAGLDRCRDAGFDGVVVLGHPEFYPRFGFASASRFKIRCEYDAPDEVFMIVELQAGALNGVSGIVRYHAAFADV